jgi:hypothetical protein
MQPILDLLFPTARKIFSGAIAEAKPAENYAKSAE